MRKIIFCSLDNIWDLFESHKGSVTDFELAYEVMNYVYFYEITTCKISADSNNKQLSNGKKKHFEVLYKLPLKNIF